MFLRILRLLILATVRSGMVLIEFVTFGGVRDVVHLASCTPVSGHSVGFLFCMGTIVK